MQNVLGQTDEPIVEMCDEIILMENEFQKPKLSLQAKSQLNFGIEYSNKISKLNVFIYGLRGVSFIIIKN